MTDDHEHDHEHDHDQPPDRDGGPCPPHERFLRAKLERHHRRHHHGPPGRHGPWHHHHRGMLRWPWPIWILRSRLRGRLFAWLALAVLAGGVLGGWASHAAGGPRWLAIVVGAIVLWTAAGVIAWRLTEPLVRLIRVARDIGDGRLDARLHLGRHGGELAMLADAVNDMATRIEAQLGEQRELMAAASHELRTPLGHMRILVETARDRGADDRTLGELERELVELDRLVDQLLARSRLDVAAVDKRDVDVGDLTRRALERAGVDAAIAEVADDAGRVWADPTLIARALGNLVDNARAHGGGVVAVVARREAEGVVIAVDDAGPGFATDDLTRVFAPFVRGATPAGAAPSTRASLGLGLALVARIAEAHGGRAWAENRTGGGARVSLAIGAPAGAATSREVNPA